MYEPLPPFGPHKNLLNSNLMSKCSRMNSFFSVDTPYYTELPPYSPETEIENWVICPLKECI